MPGEVVRVVHCLCCDTRAGGKKATPNANDYVEQDLNENQALYQKKLVNREIVASGAKVPKAATGLIELLNKDSSREVTVSSTDAH